MNNTEWKYYAMQEVNENGEIMLYGIQYDTREEAEQNAYKMGGYVIEWC